MKLYDKIWVIDKEEAPYPVQVEVRGPLICATLEELREVAKECYDEGKDAGKNDWDDPNGVFEQFCKRKGIQP